MARRRLAAAILSACFGALQPGSAYAAELRHAHLIRSEPAADSVMPADLTRFRLVFSEPVTSDLSSATVRGTDGRTIVLATAGDPRDVHALVAPVPALEPGAYRLDWRVVSADGHPVRGSFAFRVIDGHARDSAPPPPASALVPPPATTGTLSDGASAGPRIAGAPLVPALLRGTGVGALMALVGLLAFSSWLAPAPAQRSRRLALGLAVAAPLLLAGHLAAWLMNIDPFARLDARTVLTTLGTPLGRIEAARVGLAILALWALGLARRERLALIFAAASLIVSGTIGHSAAIAPAWSIPAKVLHLLGVALWLGGLSWLISADRTDPVGFVRAAVRVSSVALGAVVIIAVTGVIQTLLILPEIADIVRSAYGIGVLGKVAGLGVLVLFGTYHRYRLMPRMTDTAACTRMSRSVVREMAVMAIVVLTGGVLAYMPPPSGGSPPSTLTSSLESIR